MKRAFPVSLLLTLLLAASSQAATLRNYENRIKRASEQVERIKTDPAYNDQGIETIAELAPKTEKIEHEGKIIAVDNTWLHKLLDAYSSERDPQQKLAKLNEIGGRLRALDEELIRAEEAPRKSDDLTDARKKLDNILDRPEYKKKKESRIGAFIKEVWRRAANFLSELYSAFLRLLRNIFGASSEGGWAARLIIIAAFVAALIGIARVVKQIKPRRKRGRKRTVLGEEIEAGTSPKDLADAAMAAASAGDFRTAIRKLYVSLLYDLAERNVIELDESATNREYLARVSSFKSLIPPLEYLTERFDYCWYGKQPSSQDEFSIYLSRYAEALKRSESLSKQAAG
jgi:uncharacterized protein DUF4129